MILTARNPDRLHRVGLELGASIAAFDATDFDRLERFFDALPTPIDYLLVTGPGPYYAPLAEFDLQEARRDIDAHLFAAAVAMWCGAWRGRGVWGPHSLHTAEVTSRTALLVPGRSRSRRRAAPSLSSGHSLSPEGVLTVRLRRRMAAGVPSETERMAMKVVVIGGSGLIGSKLVNKLHERGHQAVPASPASGVNTLTGEGLAEALDGAAVVVDVSNSPSFEDAAVLKFFQTSTSNLLDAEAAAGVGHHVALSVVGTERLSESGYFRAKMAQEKLIEGSSIPYSIVHATQFFEFIKSIADAATDGSTVRLAPVLIQPMAAEDVASAVGRISLGPPVNGIVEVAGPQQFRLDELIRRGLRERHDPREVITDPHARYFGAELNERTLVPGDDASLAETRFEDWLSQSVVSKQ